MTDQRDPFGETDDLAELRSLASRLPVGPPEWEEPPAGLWERVAAEAGVPAEAGAPAEEAVPVEDDEQPSAPPAPPAPPATVTRLRPRRSPLPWVLGAVAAALVLIAGVVVLLDRPTDDPTVLASVALSHPEIADSTGAGEAELVEVDGEISLRIDTADLDPGDGFLEVWVIDAEVTKLVSLGPARADGTYDLPPGLDPEQFPVVDVSVEPLDGDPTHSGDSVLRGQLTF